MSVQTAPTRSGCAFVASVTVWPVLSREREAVAVPGRALETEGSGVTTRTFLLKWTVTPPEPAENETTFGAVLRPDETATRLPSHCIPAPIDDGAATPNPTGTSASSTRSFSGAVRLKGRYPLSRDGWHNRSWRRSDGTSLDQRSCHAGLSGLSVSLRKWIAGDGGRSRALPGGRPAHAPAVERSGGGGSRGNLVGSPASVPGEGIEPPRPRRAPGFKPGASTSSATPAGAGGRLRRLQGALRRRRSATRPGRPRRARRKRGEERAAVRARAQARIEDRDDAAVVVAADQPAEALPELEHRRRQRVVAEPVAARRPRPPRSAPRGAGRRAPRTGACRSRAARATRPECRRPARRSRSRGARSRPRSGSARAAAPAARRPARARRTARAPRRASAAPPARGSST